MGVAGGFLSPEKEIDNQCVDISCCEALMPLGPSGGLIMGFGFGPENKTSKD